MARKLLILIAVAFLGLASSKKAAFVPCSAVKDALMIRGGDHLDPTDTAKLGVILAGANAALTLMSPSRTLQMYGAPVTPMTEFLALWHGEVVLAFCLTAWQLIFKGSDLTTAMVVSSIPWVIIQYKTFWNEDHKKLGYKFEPQLISAVLGPLTLYSCLKKTSYADTMIKLTAIWVAAANGLVMTLSPQTACEGYGVEASEENKGAMKTLGFLCGGFGIFIALNAFTEMDPVQAFGYAWIPALLMQLDNSFISKTDLAKAPSYAWLFVDILMVAVCGLQLG